MQSETIFWQATVTITPSWWSIQTVHTLSFSYTQAHTYTPLTKGWQRPGLFCSPWEKSIHQVPFFLSVFCGFLKLSEAHVWLSGAVNPLNLLSPSGTMLRQQLNKLKSRIVFKIFHWILVFWKWMLMLVMRNCGSDGISTWLTPVSWLCADIKLKHCRFCWIMLPIFHNSLRKVSISDEVLYEIASFYVAWGLPLQHKPDSQQFTF